jgi:putative Holliday junction resolvase
MRVLGIDHGIARIGVAIGDTNTYLSKELMVIKRSSKAEDFERIGQIAATHKASLFVVGIPLDPDAAPDTFTPAQKVTNWVEHLRSALPYPVILWDETMTSVDAAALARRRKRDANQPIDDLAARLILQSYLDALREKRTTLPQMETE